MAILCNKHHEVLEVEMECGIITKIGEVLEKDYLPLCLQDKLTLESANKWLDKRKIPNNREGLKEAKHRFGSEYFSNYRHMFSLTDQYWFKYGRRDSWRKLNFFTNQYSSAIGKAQFTPWAVEKEELKPESPDMTTNGVLRKVWVQDESMNSFLIKAGSSYFHQEPLSEILATLTLQKIEPFIPYVHYDLCVNGLRICSRCANFVTENTEFVPAQYVYNTSPRYTKDTPYTHLIKRLDEYGLEKPKEYIDKMLFADFVIGNNDRHMGNFGVLRNVETGEVRFAPLFDFGSAFREHFQEKNTEGKVRLFGEEIPRILRLYTRNAALKELAHYEDLFELINYYPCLTVAQKEAIKAGIVERMKPFDYQDQIRGGALSR